MDQFLVQIFAVIHQFHVEKSRLTAILPSLPVIQAMRAMLEKP